MNDAEVQSQIDDLLSELPVTLKEGQFELVQWLGRYVKLNDDFRVESTWLFVAELCNEAGHSSAGTRDEKITIEEHGLEAFGTQFIAFSLYFLERGRPVPRGSYVYADAYVKHRQEAEAQV